jgi:septin family protein
VEKPQPDNRITLLAETNFHNHRRRSEIKPADRRAHIYIIGKTGIGKSTFLANLARQDATNGDAFALLDPQSDLAEQVLSFVAEERHPRSDSAKRVREFNRYGVDSPR